MPPKDKKREWIALRKQLAQERMDRELAAEQSKVRQRHDLEQKIERLTALPANEGRTKAIRLLRKRLSGS